MQILVLMTIQKCSNFQNLENLKVKTFPVNISQYFAFVDYIECIKRNDTFITNVRP